MNGIIGGKPMKLIKAVVLGGILVLLTSVSCFASNDLYVLLPETTMVKSLDALSELTDILEEPNPQLMQKRYHNLKQTGHILITEGGSCLVFIPELEVLGQWMGGHLEIAPTATIYVPRDSIVKITLKEGK
jgi:hypothetical protein